MSSRRVEERVASCREVAEEAALALAFVEGEGRLLRYANPAFCRLVGRPPEALRDRPLLELMPEALAAGFAATLDEAARSGQRVSSAEPDDSDLPAPGEPCWRLTAWPPRVPEPDEGRGFLLVELSDVTPLVEERRRLVTGSDSLRAVNEQLILAGVREQELADAELRQREELEALADNIAQLAWMADEEGSAYWFNRRWFSVTGTTLEQAAGTGWLDMVDPEHAERVGRGVREAFARGSAYEDTFPLRSGDGPRRWFLSQVVPVRDGEGRLRRWVGTLTDVTRARELEEALRESEARFRIMADSSPVMIWVHDADGELEFVNRAYLEFFGKTGEEVVRAPWTPLVHPDDARRYTDAFLTSLRQGTGFHAQARVRHHSGEWRWVESYGAPRFSPTGELLGMVGSSPDITATKQAEEALAEANRRKDEFLAMLSHELRNPLAPIRNSLYVLARANPGEEKARRVRAIIERQITHLTRLVDDLLDVTRISRGKILLQKERLELGELLVRTVEDHREIFSGNRLELEDRIGEEPMWVFADRTRIAQIAGNLLGNAAKFTPPGGRVQVSLEREGEQAVLRVRDTGVGIAPAMLARIFDPFSQSDRTLERAAGGLGLGLALVKGLAELHGGSVTAASAGPGEGAELTVRLPLAAAPEESAPAPEARASQTRRVLIVEDNEDSAESLRQAVELMGHEVRVAGDGLAALAAARAFRPHAVICDIGLPGIDGYEFARRFRADPALGEATVLVAVTGYALPEDRERAEAAGFTHHVAKPPDLGQLESILAGEGAGARVEEEQPRA